MHSFTTISIAALAALTLAAPHYSHKHLHHRSVEPATLVIRDLGACGGDSGATCGTGYCCSAFGYCGISPAYCAAGCQSDFGTCSDNSTAATGTESSLTIKTAAFSAPWGGPHSSSWGASESSAPASSAAATTWASSSSSPAETSTSAIAYSTTTFATSTVSSTSAVSTSSPAPSSYSAPASTSSAAAPTSTTSSGGSGSGSDSYKVYSGDGSTATGWPDQSAWIDFDSMWTANMAYISISCTQFGESNNSDQESDDLKSAIQSVASSSGIDERFILAIAMQESKGCVRTPTTNYGVNNPGIMQSHDGAGSCNNGGTVQDPCPASEITQMIKDGATGTAAGDGLEQCITESDASDVSKYYKAARIYNSGSIATSGNLDDGIATHCYVSDIANRLTGWVKATTTCNL
ncbi:hypothetical protein LTR08_007467 [Meristemomyces frigidus]|nr:hypothetical protein LTR08_007467 [Meristemomyces frigidus]